MAFIVYDVILLILFAVFVSIFLYLGRKNLKREGLLFLYKAKWGIKLINYTGNKYKTALKFLSYISIGLGYILMAGIIYLFGKLVYIYTTLPHVVKAVKVPPVMPLIPYVDKLVPGLPEFYFTYWIIILAIIAITHEFAHGIFAAYNKIKIKSTGFGFFPFFLPVFLAAFVELDEKKMAKKPKLAQLAVLSAGTFANTLTAIFFFIVLWAFFSAAFVPSGVIFDSYATSKIAVKDITSINNIPLENPSYDRILEIVENLENSNAVQNAKRKYIEVKTSKNTYFATKEILEMQKKNDGWILVYASAPAIKAGIIGAITEINGKKVTDMESFKAELLKYSPGDKITIKTAISENEFRKYEVVLEQHPEFSNESVPWLGVGFAKKDGKGVLRKLYSKLSSFKDPHVYYKPLFNGVATFIYNLLWWIVLISISVALINMLPVGIFDGGRFFYLTVLGITGSESAARKAFGFVTYIFLFLLFIIMAFWALSFFS